MSNIIVLGAGMVGSAMAIDLSKKHKVTLADFSIERLKYVKEKCQAIDIIKLNVCNKDNLRVAIEEFDLVICAVPGFLGYETLKTIIETQKDVVDISFFPESALSLTAFAKEKGVTAIVDCGVAPGMDNLFLGRYNELLELTDF